MVTSRIISFIAFILLTISLHAQIIPAEGSKLNYRLAGFSVPENAIAQTYLLEVAKGYYNDEKPFSKNICISVKDTQNKIIAILPEFGAEYTWSISFLNSKGKKKGRSSLYHFTTLKVPYVDTNQYKLQIIDTAANHTDRLLLVDHSGIMYDLKGDPLWYLPDITDIFDRNMPNRDLKLTNTGTFTLTNNHGAFEFDYNGNIVWRAPDTSLHYHHELTKLSNHHYMVCGMEQLTKKIPADVDTCAFPDDGSLRKISGAYYRQFECGTLLEYDSIGNIVWKCPMSQYFSDDYFFLRMAGASFFQSDLHMNSFDFDEKNSVIYVSFRNISCILKIEYPSGKLLTAYGKLQFPEKTRANGLVMNRPFNAQHNVRVSKDNRIYMFNNNSDRIIEGKRDMNRPSTVVMFNQVQDGGLQKIWEISCDIDTLALPGTATGGSVQLLNNDNILVGMGLAGRTFIVSPEKKIVWNAVVKFKPIADRNFETMPMYRVFGIENKNALQQAIFRSQPAK